jgi:hypothetical protein
MVRSLAVIAALWCLAASAWAQTPPATGAAPTQAAMPVAKPAAKKPAPKAKAAASPVGPAESGPCQIGVISAVGDRFTLQHIGLTVFGNEFTEAPIESWGLDDLVVTRVRAAAVGSSVRRIAYSRGAFEPYYHPPKQLFRDASNDLPAVVRQIAMNANCGRYLVITRSGGQVAGTNQIAEGIGVLTNWSSGAFKKGALFAFIRVTVFDGKTFAKHEDPLGGFGARLAASLSKLTKDENFQSLDDFEAPATPEAVASNVRLRDGARAMLAARLDKILPAYLNDSNYSSNAR